jgi:hypothetical protein
MTDVWKEPRSQGVSSVKLNQRLVFVARALVLGGLVFAGCDDEEKTPGGQDASTGATPGEDAPTNADATVDETNNEAPEGLSASCAALYVLACTEGCTDNEGVSTETQCGWATEDNCELCKASLATFAGLKETCGWDNVPAPVDCE